MYQFYNVQDYNENIPLDKNNGGETINNVQIIPLNVLNITPFYYFNIIHSPDLYEYIANIVVYDSDFLMDKSNNREKKINRKIKRLESINTLLQTKIS